MRGPVTDTRREDILSCTGVAFLRPWVARGCSSSPVPALRSSIMLIIKWQIAVLETQKPTTPACAPRGVKARLQGMPPTPHPPGGFLWRQNAEGFIDHCRSCSDRQQLPASLGVRQPAPHVHTMPVQPGMPSPTPVIPEGLDPCELLSWPPEIRPVGLHLWTPSWLTPRSLAPSLLPRPGCGQRKGPDLTAAQKSRARPPLAFDLTWVTVMATVETVGAG